MTGYTKKKRAPHQKTVMTAAAAALPATPPSMPPIVVSEGQLDSGGIFDTTTPILSADKYMERVDDTEVDQDGIQSATREKIVKAQAIIQHAKEASQRPAVDCN